MPARKPQDLHTRHSTQAEKDARTAAEASLKPRRELPIDAPARLKDHDIASATWRRVMRTYAELDAEIVTRLDLELLLNYCLLIEELGEISGMRKVAYLIWLELGKEHEKLTKAHQFDDAVIVATQVVGAFEAILKLDTRLDRKRALLHQWSQSLYLTPRARAGVAPSKKADEPPPDDMGQLLDDVMDYMNGAVQ